MVGDPGMGPKWQDRFEEYMIKALREGSVTARLEEWVGMDNAADAFVKMLNGKNFGKAILKIKV
jgi:NADPH-dependent curcumin reductase CurA